MFVLLFVYHVCTSSSLPLREGGGVSRRMSVAVASNSVEKCSHKLHGTCHPERSECQRTESNFP